MQVFIGYPFYENQYNSCCYGDDADPGEEVIEVDVSGFTESSCELDQGKHRQRFECQQPTHEWVGADGQ